MNMKKTIAAIAAGAVAVSAMATTVSAVEAKTLNYNLVNSTQDESNGKLTLKATFPNVPLTDGQEVAIKVKGMGWTDKIVVSGQYIDTNKAINPITITRNVWAEGYSAVTEGYLGNYTPAHPDADTVYLPVRAVNTIGTPALIGGTAAVAGTPAVPGTPAVAEAATGIVTNGTSKSALTINLANLKLNQEPDADATYNLTFDGTAWKNGTTAVNLADFGVDATDAAVAAAVDGSTIAIKYTAHVDEVPGTPAVEATGGPITANITVTATLTNIKEKDWENVNKRIQHPTHADGLGISLNGVWGDATGSGYTAPTKLRAPLMTGLSDNLNIIAYLENANVNGDSKGYKNVGAVLNDAIENYDGVTFTFNTATANVAWGVADIGVKGASKYNPKFVWTTNDGKQKDRTNAANEYSAQIEKTDKWGDKYNDWKYDRDQYILMGYYPTNEWEGVDTYTAFGEHTYDWYYAPEGTGFTGYDWGGTNLFAGALVINENYTMSLSNTEYFDWTKTSLSFDWEAIMDNAATTNNYATYIHSIKLATSQYWFWDSMDVVLTVGEADDVSADAGVTADDATLDDDDDDITADDDDVEPADDDDDDEPAPVVDEPVAAPVATNPPTGNAPVALAVIPVALAAAAIVAKKRG